MKLPVLLATLLLTFTAHAAEKAETAIYSGGCFWGMEEVFRKVPGVVSTKVGYTGGTVSNPSYEQVSSGKTGHAESIQIEFDPKKITYENLTKMFFRMHDPTSLNRQGNDIGTQYRSEIFYMNDAQKQTAEKVIALVNESKKWPAPVVTKLEPAKTFYPAEDYHQKYLVKNPHGYNDHFVRAFTFSAEGWDAKTFVRPSKAELKKKLTSLQYEVTQEDGTEPPFHNEYYNNHRAGIYVDIVSGEPLFSSTDKFDSGTGWPSFTKPIKAEAVTFKGDHQLPSSERTEVRSKYADSHLGHVFDDGPAPTHKRYCMDSASLRFIPAEELKAKGYGEFAGLFGGHK